MIIQRGQNVIVLPERADKYSVGITVFSEGTQERNPGGYWTHAFQVDGAELPSIDFYGSPERWALRPDRKTIVLYPSSDCEREVRVQYYPEARVL